MNKAASRVLSLLSALLLPALASALPKVAVLDLSVQKGIDASVVAPVTESLMEEVVGSRAYVVLDRAYIEQVLKEKLLSSGLEPSGFAIPLRNMRAEADLFRAENLPLLTEHEKTALEYDKVVGSRSVQWEGRELTVTRLVGELSGAPREVRERGWLLAMERVLSDSGEIDSVWTRLMGIRKKIAANAGLSDYREYAWRQRLRFDYGPADSAAFRDAIEQSVVPAARRVYERRAKRLGVSSLRPWDVSVDVMRQTDINVDCFGRPALRPFKDASELERKIEGVFDRVDPRVGGYFRTMREERLYDLDNYKGKTPGAYCTGLNASRRPFVLMNAAGAAGDVDTCLHEMGHAFHTFQCYRNPALRYCQLWDYPAEFAEALANLLQNPEQRQRLAREAREYVQEWSAPACAGRLRQALVDLLHSRMNTGALTPCTSSPVD